MIIGKYSKIEHNLYHKLNYQFEQSRLMNSLETETFRNRRDIVMNQSIESRCENLATFGYIGGMSIHPVKKVKNKSEFFK